jgi:hypothetical protein
MPVHRNVSVVELPGSTQQTEIIQRLQLTKATVSDSEVKFAQASSRA